MDEKRILVTAESCLKDKMDKRREDNGMNPYKMLGRLQVSTGRFCFQVFGIVLRLRDESTIQRYRTIGKNLRFNTSSRQFLQILLFTLIGNPHSSPNFPNPNHSSSGLDHQNSNRKNHDISVTISCEFSEFTRLHLKKVSHHCCDESFSQNFFETH